MKIKCLKNDLQKALNIVEKNTSRNITIPILNSILFEVKKDKLIIKATNLDICVEVVVNSDIKKQGIVALPSRAIVGYINAIKKDEFIELELINENISINSEKNSTIIKTIPNDDFPVIPKTQEKISFSIPSKKIITGIKSVVYSSSTSDIKPEISSVYLYNIDKNLIFVATDSFRLAEKKINAENIKDITPVLIPYRNALEIIRILDDNDEEIKITIDKSIIVLEGENIKITSRVTEGVFPNYKQIITNVFKTEVFINKEDLLNSLKIASVFSDNTNQISMNIIPDDSLIEVESKNQDTGENISKIDSEIKGDPINISFNQKYINECLPIIEEDKVSMKFNGVGKPIIINGIGNKSFMYLIMPMTR